jgi:hypothetical protein
MFILARWQCISSRVSFQLRCFTALEMKGGCRWLSWCENECNMKFVQSIGSPVASTSLTHQLVGRRNSVAMLFCRFGSPAGSLCNHASSVSRARFVTTGAIDPKLCTYVPLGKRNSQAKFQSRQPSWKTNKVLLLLN